MRNSGCAYKVSRSALVLAERSVRRLSHGFERLTPVERRASFAYSYKVVEKPTKAVYFPLFTAPFDGASDAQFAETFARDHPRRPCARRRRRYRRRRGGRQVARDLR